MNKITGFSVRKVKMRGFKCFGGEAEFDFGDRTFISGANALGKSSFADAIAYAFTGVSFFGDRGLDRLHSENGGELEVSVSFTDDSGGTHNITRYRKKDVTHAVFDLVNVRQSDLTEVFCDRDLFLSIFNPLYFIEVLQDKGKELLERILPAVKYEDVMAELSEATRTTLAREHMISPEVFIKNRRADIRICEENRLYLQGQQDLLSDQKKAASASIAQANNELVPIEEEISRLEEAGKTGRSKDEIESRLAELYGSFDTLESKRPRTDAIDKIAVEIRSMESAREKALSAEYVSAYTGKIAEHDAVISILYGEHGKLTGSLNDVQPGFLCPSCYREVTEDNMAAVKDEIQGRIDECVKAGKKARADLKEAADADKRSREAFKDEKSAEVTQLNTALCELRGKLAEEEEKHKKAEKVFNDTLITAYTEVQTLERSRDHGNLSDEQIERLQTLSDRKRELQLQIGMQNEVINKEDYSEQIKRNEDEISRLNHLVSAAVLYAGKRNELLFNSLKMNKASVSLYDVVKSTGEIKDTFKFTFEGRDYRMLSLSEKIRAGLELAELIKRLSGRDYPTFVDNSESICIIDNVRPSGQLIFSSVVKGSPLKVTYKNKKEDLRKAG